MNQTEANIVIHKEWLEPQRLQLVALLSLYKGRWLWVRNRNRTTWEFPGGHIEHDESPDSAANRELFEETGALHYKLMPLFDYTVKLDGAESHARMYIAEVQELGLLPDSEIGEVSPFERVPEPLTYPRVQGQLFKLTLDFLKSSPIKIENGQ